MYQCSSCGSNFQQPVRYREALGECFGFLQWEYLNGCPYCGGAYQQAPGFADSAAAVRAVGDKATKADGTTDGRTTGEEQKERTDAKEVVR